MRSLALLFACWVARADVQFDGIDDTLSVAVFSTAVQNFTIMSSFQMDTQLENGCIVYNGSTSTDGYGIMVSDGACGVGSTLVVQVGAIGCNVTSSVASLTPGTWYHVALTRDTTTWRLYVNGVESSTVIGVAPNVPTGSFNVGGNGVLDNVKGRIANVEFYSRALSPAEIGAVALSRQFRTIGPSLQGWWLLNSVVDGVTADGTPLIDRSGNGRNMTGSDGPNNSGCIGRSSYLLSYP